MLVVRLHSGSQVYLVVAAHITHLVDYDDQTGIHFVNGEKLTVDGRADEIAMKLQGKR